MKPKQALLTALALTLPLAGAKAQFVNPPAGLVGWWSGDGHPLDIAGRHDGALHYEAGYTAGFDGRAFSFPTDFPWRDGYVRTPGAPELNFGADQDFTVAAWIKPMNYTNGLWNTIVCKHNGPGLEGWAFALNANTHEVCLFEASGGAAAVLPSGVVPPLGAWTHVAAMRQGSNTLFFIDGAWVRTEPGLTNTLANDVPVLIGSWYDTRRPSGSQTENGFKGLIDEVLLFNRALDSNEVALLASGQGLSKTNAYPPSGLVSWWRGEGNTTDATGAHPGTPLGGLSYTNGQVGQAFKLNGTDAAVALGNWFTLQQFTLSLWVKPSPSQNTYADLLDNNHSDWRSWAIQHDNVSDATRTYWHWGTSIPSGGGSVGFSLAHNTWQHWVVTLGADRVHRLYRDGKLIGSTTNTAAIPYDGSQMFHLGRWGGGGRFFNGLADELMVFDRALDSAEVTSLFVNQGGPATIVIQRQAGNVLTSWLAGAPDLLLQVSPDLSTNSWQTVTNGIQPAGQRSTYSVPATNAHQFFRLKSGN